jgi:hypothetical protein
MPRSPAWNDLAHKSVYISIQKGREERMSHLLELPDDLYITLLRTAESAGTTPVELLRRQFALSPGDTAAPSIAPEMQQEKLTPDLLSLLEEIAPVRGLSVEELTARWLKEPSLAFRNKDSSTSGASDSSFEEKYCGIYASGNPASGDNDRIEADLAREYGKDWEPV